MNYYLTGYSKVTGKLIYRSALTSDLKQLLIDKNNMINQFEFLFMVRKY